MQAKYELIYRDNYEKDYFNVLFVLVLQELQEDKKDRKI